MVVILLIVQWVVRSKCLFNDAINTFHLQLFGVRYLVNAHSESEKGNPHLSLQGLLFLIGGGGGVNY